MKGTNRMPLIRLEPQFVWKCWLARTIGAAVLAIALIPLCSARAANDPIKAFCIDFNWGEGGPNGFAKPGLWADASPEEHVAWYAGLGCNVIQTFAVSCNGYAWYKGGRVPPQPGLKYDFLADTVKLGHQPGHEGDGLFLRRCEHALGPDAHQPQLRRAQCAAHPVHNRLSRLPLRLHRGRPPAHRHGRFHDRLGLEPGRPRRQPGCAGWSASSRCIGSCFGEAFPGKDKITPERELEFRRRAIDRCWERIRATTKRVKPDAVIWLSCCNVSSPVVVNSKLFKEVDWLMNEATDPKSLQQVAEDEGPAHPAGAVCRRLGRCPRRAAYSVGRRRARPRHLRLRQAGPNSLPLPIAEYRSRSIASFQGNDRNIAVLARYFTGASLEIVVPQEPDGSIKLLPGTATMPRHQPGRDGEPDRALGQSGRLGGMDPGR